MKWIVFVNLIVLFFLPCARRDNSLNYPSLYSLALCVFNIWCSSNRSPIVGSRTALILIMSDMNFSSSADRWMVAFALCETIGLERLWICLDSRSVFCGECVAGGGFTLVTLVVSFEWSCTLGTIVGCFDWTFTLGTLVGIGGLVGGSHTYQLLKISFCMWCLQVVEYCFS